MGDYLTWSIWPIAGALTIAATPDQSGLWINGNEGLLHFPQIFLTGSSPKDAV